MNHGGSNLWLSASIRFVRRVRFPSPTGCAAFLVAGAILVAGCGRKKPPAQSVANGKMLAAIACAQCHTVPSPAHLSPEEWPYLLAWMGNYVGQPPGLKINPALVAKCFVPPQPVVTHDQFEAIRDYFLKESAVQYHLPAPEPKPPVSPLFEPLPFAGLPPVISMVGIDPSNQSLLVGASLPPRLLVLERGKTTTIKVPSEPVTFERLGPVTRVALIGDLGHDARAGQIVDFNFAERTQQVLVEGHPRIAAHKTADLDGDGHEDLLVCGFGDYPVGRVGIYWGGGSNSQEQVLFEEAGADWCDIADLDGDGDLDIVLAIANNRPRLLAFVNEGNRRFVPRPIIERHVGWGYNRCELVDWDGDGKLDIVTLAGNNLELRGRPLKPWHGVRVLHNDGNWKFHQVLFEPLPGAIDVAAGDFDGNGRVDLAVTAFYPDWRLPVPTTFLLLLQQSDGTVKRAGLDDRYWNRWMRVYAGDADGDGDTDLILGAAETPAGVPSEQLDRYHELLKGKATVLLLRNQRIHKTETQAPQSSNASKPPSN